MTTTTLNPALAATRPPAVPLWEKHGEAITTVLCAVFVGAGWLAHRAGLGAVATALIFVVGYVLGGYRQAIEGTTTLFKDRELDVDLLMVVAAIGAAAIGYWFDGALLIFIFALSGTLEGYASARTKRDIEALIALHPEDALVVRDGRERRVPAVTLAVDELLIVKPGERIAADGIIAEGTSAVNQASITGESMPADKRAGDEVFAGTINGHGALRVTVTRPAADTILARMIQLVQEAQERRPPAQLFIERFERGYAKVVVVGAIAVVALPSVAHWWTFREALYRAMIFLVVASPCALAASMMPTLLSALSNGARNGILFKGSTFIESLGRVRAVAFDKTGTLTSGHPVVTDVISLSTESEDELLTFAAAIESLSEHPLARAIVREAERRNLKGDTATNLQSVPGTGAHAIVAGQTWSIGKATLFPEASDTARARHQALTAEGKTVVMLGAGTVRGLIGLRDTLRPRAGDAVRTLRDFGLDHVVLITGDTRQTADAIGRNVGITEIHAELLPADKVRVVDELVRRYGRVAMVGDGVNDGPALAAASVGIAMGVSGTDVALETADVVLTTDDLEKIPYAVALGRQSLRVVKQNLVLALGMIVILIVSDLLGWITLPWGVVGHEGSTLLVTLNGLRLLRQVRLGAERAPRG
ncbi:MAG TPA: heavy metal translocating P-type ATPase [Polyangiaceae bacterium]|jgi:Cd2+/Zn2+-exporting ATPase|nr:heavy metal translocating P-type ATPase [Polyangiaceae bacterium]